MAVFYFKMTIGQRLQRVGKNFSQGLNLAAKSLVVDVVNNASYRGEGANDGGMWFFGNNGIDLHFNYTGHKSAIEAMNSCPPVSSVITKKVQAHINGITKIENSKGSDANSPEAKKLKALLKNPNPLQTWKQFEAQTMFYVNLFGYTMILPIKPYGFSNIDATALWNIPPFMIDIKETKELFFNNPKGIIGKIILTYKGIRTELNPEDIVIIEDFVPSFDSLVIPESRLKAVSLPINNIIGAYESRGHLINNRGARGILSPEIDQMGTIALMPSDKEALQNDFAKYGLKKNQWQVIITNAALKWQQMGWATKDLMLFEEIADDTAKICDALAYPFKLLGSEASTNLNASDAKHYKKMLYEDTIIPEANNLYEQLNQLFGLEALNLVLRKDYSHLGIMQDDINQSSQTYYRLNQSAQMMFLMDMITQNQYRKIISTVKVFGEIPITDDGDVKYSDIKDKIGKATLKAGEISQVDPGDEGTVDPNNKQFSNQRSIKNLNEPILNILEFPELRQVFNFDCGASAFQSVFVYYGIEKREDFILQKLEAQHSDVFDNGVHLASIINLSSDYGVSAVLKQGLVANNLLQYINSGSPVIVLLQAWRDDNNKLTWSDDYRDGHYVVAIGYTKDKIIFSDPSSFYRTFLSFDELNERWHAIDDEGNKNVVSKAIVFSGQKRFDSTNLEHMD